MLIDFDFAKMFWSHGESGFVRDCRRLFVCLSLLLSFSSSSSGRDDRFDRFGVGFYEGLPFFSFSSFFIFLNLFILLLGRCHSHAFESLAVKHNFCQCSTSKELLYEDGASEQYSPRSSSGVKRISAISPKFLFCFVSVFAFSSSIQWCLGPQKPYRLFGTGGRTDPNSDSRR